jgi:hypothetical protein
MSKRPLASKATRLDYAGVADTLMQNLDTRGLRSYVDEASACVT